MLTFLLLSFLLPAHHITIEKPPLILENQIITAYSPSIEETDSEPEIGAYGRVYEGTLANNCYKKNTIVEIAGKNYRVMDRKNRRYSCEWWDVFMKNKQAALNFGIKKNQTIKIIK